MHSQEVQIVSEQEKEIQFVQLTELEALKSKSEKPSKEVEQSSYERIRHKINTTYYQHIALEEDKEGKKRVHPSCICLLFFYCCCWLLITLLILCLILARKESKGGQDIMSFELEFSKTSLVSQDVSLVCTIQAPSGLNQENRAPISVSTVLDRSGSMDETFPLLQKSAKYFVDILEQGDSLSIISYSDDSRIDAPLTRITEDSKGYLKNEIDSIDTAGGTNLAAGLFDGLDQQYYETNSVNTSTIKRVMLFTDGLANEGTTDLDEILYKMLTYLDIEYPPVVLTIGYGPEVDSNFLKTIAATSGGTYYYIGSESDIETNMDAILSSLLEVRLQLLTLTFVPRSSTTITNIIGGTILSTDVSWTVTYSDLYDGEIRDILVDLRLPSVNTPITSQHILTIILSYFDPLTNKNIEEVSEIYIQRDDEAIVETSSAAVEIVRLRAYVITVVYAVLDFDANDDSQSAISAIDEAIRQLENSNVASFDEIQAYIKFLTLIKDEIEKDGKLSPESRSEIYSAAYSISTQRTLADDSQYISVLSDVTNSNNDEQINVDLTNTN